MSNKIVTISAEEVLMTQMRGKLFMHNGENERFFDFEIKGQQVTIKTSVSTYKKDKSEIPDFIGNFLPVDETPAITQLQSVNSSTLVELRTALMDSIKKVQEDEKYISQAQQVSKTSQTIINLAKVEIDMRKTLKDL